MGVLSDLHLGDQKITGKKLAILLKKDYLIWLVDAYVLVLHGPNPYLLFWNVPFFRDKKLLFWGGNSGWCVWFSCPKTLAGASFALALVSFLWKTDPRCSYAGTGFRNIGSPAFGMKRKPFHGGGSVPGKGGRAGGKGWTKSHLFGPSGHWRIFGRLDLMYFLSVETSVANHTYHHIPAPLQGVPTKPYDTL